MLGRAFDDLLPAAQAGAGWAFTRIYEDLAGTVTGYLRRQGAIEPDDVASETFLDVFRGIGSFEGDEDGFRSWVFTIAHRRLLDERRRGARRPRTRSMQDWDGADGLDGVDGIDGAAAADRTVVAAAEWARLERHLRTLTPGQRDVLLLRVVAGLSVADTAGVVARSEAAVRQLQRRGLRALESSLLEEATAEAPTE